MDWGSLKRGRKIALLNVALKKEHPENNRQLLKTCGGGVAFLSLKLLNEAATKNRQFRMAMEEGVAFLNGKLQTNTPKKIDCVYRWRAGVAEQR